MSAKFGMFEDDPSRSFSNRKKSRGVEEIKKKEKKTDRRKSERKRRCESREDEVGGVARKQLADN
ncbi:hypothetical protein RUM43_011150 [Polyplax serrata]|uniref:Uncharacterized protein n=1 Tax=Polyplax serrata TaxID=468196 RepID=A0AAN8S3J5_POLSC